MLSEILTAIGTILTDIIPALGTGVLNLFRNLFLVSTVSDGVTTWTGLSELGVIAIFFIVYYFCVGLLPKVMGIMKLGFAKIKARRRKVRAR